MTTMTMMTRTATTMTTTMSVQQKQHNDDDDDDDGIGLNCLDLGSDNASVLYRVLWSCQKHEIPVQMAIIT